MYRSSLILLVVLISLFYTGCVRYVDPTVPEAERLLRTGSWVLAYTDSSAVDSMNVWHFFHIPATDCEREESISFTSGIRYQMHLVCNQAVPGELIGEFSFDPDSTLAFNLRSDTIIYLIPGKLIMVNHDSLKIAQQSSFAAPNVLYAGFVEKTYSR